jgi:hypothetical protein
MECGLRAPLSSDGETTLRQIALVNSKPEKVRPAVCSDERRHRHPG